MSKDPVDLKADATGTPNLDANKIGQSGNFYSTKDAMIIYTSGSTGLPKGIFLYFNSVHWNFFYHICYISYLFHLFV